MLIPPQPHWGELLSQAENGIEMMQIADLLWVPLRRKGMAERVERLVYSHNPDVAALANHWLYLPDPTPYEWQIRE